MTSRPVAAAARAQRPPVTDETWGPRLTAKPVPTLAEGGRLATASRYGLGASVFTKNKKAGMRAARALRTGMASVNSALTVLSVPALPFGGVGDSGVGDYAFRHALPQEAAYEDLLPGERQRIHRAFAEALAERGPGPGAVAAGDWAELAYHWSATRDDDRALEASVRAGIAAMDAYAFADALRHFETALDLWSSVDEPEAVPVRLAQTLALGGGGRR